MGRLAAIAARAWEWVISPVLDYADERISEQLPSGRTGAPAEVPTSSTDGLGGQHFQFRS